MPFKSEKQRRYLWANEPRIAREWTDRYGARHGGIMNGLNRRNYLTGGITDIDTIYNEDMQFAPDVSGEYWSNLYDSAKTGAGNVYDFISDSIFTPAGAGSDLVDVDKVNAMIKNAQKSNWNSIYGEPNEAQGGIVDVYDQDYTQENMNYYPENLPWRSNPNSLRWNIANKFSKTKEGLDSLKTNVGQKMGQGWDVVQQIPGMALSALTGIPGLGFILDAFKSTPEQKSMMNLYNSPEYQSVLNQIPGMANYNPTYMTGKGYGLEGAIDKRIGTIDKTLKSMIDGTNWTQLKEDDYDAWDRKKKTLEKRKKDLQTLKNLEKNKFTPGKTMDDDQKETITTTITKPGTNQGNGGGGGSWGGHGSVQAYDKSQKATYDRAVDRHRGNGKSSTSSSSSSGGWGPWA